MGYRKTDIDHIMKKIADRREELGDTEKAKDKSNWMKAFR